MNKLLKTSDTKLKKEPEQSSVTTAIAIEPQPIASPQMLVTSQNDFGAMSEISDDDLAALATEARDLNDDTRVGDDLRFKKGKWLKIVAEEKREIGKTTSFAVDLRSYQRGWIRWDNKKPTCKLIGRPIDGFVSPVRGRLPDQDKSLWSHVNGQPTDPWQETLMITMRDLSDDRLCTLTITSWYGRQALGAFLAAATRECKKHPRTGGPAGQRRKIYCEFRRSCRADVHHRRLEAVWRRRGTAWHADAAAKTAASS